MNTDCPYILESMAINYDDNRRIATHPLFMSNMSDMKKDDSVQIAVNEIDRLRSIVYN